MSQIPEYGKRKLYEVLGVTEYVVCDVQCGLLDPNDVGVPWMSEYCLQPDGRYALVPGDPLLSEAVAPAYYSRTLGTYVRLQGPCSLSCCLPCLSWRLSVPWPC